MCFSFLGSVPALLSRELAEEVLHFRNQAFAANTKRTYSTHRNAFLSFCTFMNLPPVPASSSTICLYAAFLARSLKFSSIPQYLGIIGLLHKKFGLANPLTGNWHLSSLITGIKRVLGHERLQKLPVTPSLLLKIYKAINPSYSVDASFWAICLVAFYGMFRKSHLLVQGNSQFDPDRQFLKSDFRFFPWGPLCWFVGARLFNFVSVVSQFLFQASQGPPYVQFLPFCIHSLSPAQPPYFSSLWLASAPVP